MALLRGLLYVNSQSVVIAFLGAMFTIVLGLDNVASSSLMGSASLWILIIGIYLAGTGISIEEVKKHWRLVVIALSICVVLKWALLSLLMLTPVKSFALLVFIGLVQIDPTTTFIVKGLLNMSDAGKAVIGMVSTFDDLVTSVMSISSLIVLTLSGVIDASLPALFKS
jgi:hypothetical protein